MNVTMLLAVLLLAACADPESAPQPASPTSPAREVMLVIDGQSPLAQAAARALDGKSVTFSGVDRMPVVNPGASTEYKIRVAGPDPSVDYSILEIPGESWDDIRVVDPKTGRVRAPETQVVKDLLRRASGLEELARFYEGEAKPANRDSR